MNLPTQALFVLCILPLCAPGGASAQEDNKWGKPVDLKALIPPLPPIVPMPRNYQLNPGTVGGTQTPYTATPLENPGVSSTQGAPGIRLSIPTR
jgi:hypothetical protein